MAHKKGVGSSKNGRDSSSKRLGIKVFNNQKVKIGQIIIKQRGLIWRPLNGVFISKDFSIHAKKKGIVKFMKKKKKKYITII
ncbi:MAG: 50S ribosomal protein L27 [Candidatus Shikimatogenerans sp. Tduv]|uniref:Large ribosomal subunit protein bL27 n=1 Tax=Candidatus Shikimatogenerans sp. Tduv TaxID=3158567 RepID=A0AAU7QQW7_9FLAO